MRAYMSQLYGNAANKDLLGRLIENGTLPHALIIEGASGSGKRTLAKQIIAASLCENRTASDKPLPCGSCRSCRLVLEGKATDVSWISRADKATLGVDLVRAAKSDMYLSANEFGSKFYIFEDAHTMTAQAQNALLVALEEPPKSVSIILLAESASALLSTVRSRARLVRTEIFSREETRTFLAENYRSLLTPYEANEPLLSAILTEADGSIGRALALLDARSSEELHRDREAIDEILSALTGRSFSALHTAFSALPTKRDELIRSLTLLGRALRDIILLKRAKNAPLCYYASANTVPKEPLSLRMTALLRTLSEVENAMQRLERNANVATVLNVLKYNLKKG